MSKEEIAERVGEVLGQVVAKVSFMLWQKEDFRELIDFDKISQTEQDRIFNELEVSFLGLFILYLENLSDDLKGQDDQKVVDVLKEKLPKGFVSVFRNLGVEEKFVRMWEQLIKMRLDEYHEDYGLLLKEGKKIKGLKDDEAGLRFRWARVEAITLACLQHTRRGKLDEKDPLRKYLQGWIIGTDQIFVETIKDLVFKPVGRA